MASEKTLAIRSAAKVQKAQKAQQRQALAQAQQQGAQQQQANQAAAQFITSTAQAIFIENVLLAPSGLSVEELYAFYENQAHKAMDAGIAFVRASNSYDDRGRVAPAAPAIVAAPVDANGTPVTE